MTPAERPSEPNVVAGKYGNVWSYFCRDCQHFEQPFPDHSAAIVASFGHQCSAHSAGSSTPEGT